MCILNKDYMCTCIEMYIDMHTYVNVYISIFRNIDRLPGASLFTAGRYKTLFKLLIWVFLLHRAANN